MARIDSFLRVMLENNASDLHLAADCVPMFRIHGVLGKARHRTLAADEVKFLLYEILTDTQIERFESRGELDLAYTVPGVARFRINVFKKHSGMAGAVRMIPHHVPTLDGLGLPAALKDLLGHRSGLLVVTGPADSGKSTTLAAMVDHLNEHCNYHVITLEDPLEYIHTSKNCLINQRQIGEHSHSFSSALRAALHEDPNVIVVGEMSDPETMWLAITAAERGLFVMGTLPTGSATQTIGRIVDVFPSDRQPSVRHALSEMLLGTVSQRLLRRADGSGRIAALEILVGTTETRELIRAGTSDQVTSLIVAGKKDGMQLLDEHLKEFVTQHVVTVEEAVRRAADPQAMLLFGEAMKDAEISAGQNP